MKTIEDMIAEKLCVMCPQEIECNEHKILKPCGGAYNTVKAILNLTYPCSLCGGSGDLDEQCKNSYIPKCLQCNGTGKGEKILAVLDENQEKPEVDRYDLIDYVMGYEKAQQDMKAWKKVREDA